MKDDSLAWRKRDRRVEVMIKEIDEWLKNQRHKFNTSYYDSIVKIYLEFGRINEKQFQTLENILIRCVRK